MVDPAMGVSFGDQICTSMIVVWILQQLKKAAWLPWLTQHTDILNRLLSVLLGSIAAAGIVWTFDPTAGTLVVHGLTLANGASFLWIVLKQVAFQEGVYKGLVKPSADAAAAKSAAVKTKADIISAVDGQ